MKKLLMILVLCLGLVGCGSEKEFTYIPNETLLSYCDEEMADICLNYVLEYEKKIDELRNLTIEDEYNFLDFFDSPQINLFKNITVDDWTGKDMNNIKDEEEFKEYQKSVKVYSDFFFLAYRSAIESTDNVYTDDNILYEDISYKHNNETTKNNFCTEMDEKIDYLLNEYFIIE